MWKKIKPYVISVIIALAVGGLSALITKDNMDIYSRIVSPPLAPPSVLFPIVWTILFALMGVSSAIVYNKKKKMPEQVQSALSVYAVNLALNFVWSILFFNFDAYLISFIWLVLLWIVIFKMIREFKKISPTAAYLQIPYLIWVTFAGYLNLAIYILNR